MLELFASILFKYSLNISASVACFHRGNLLFVNFESSRDVDHANAVTRHRTGSRSCTALAGPRAELTGSLVTSLSPRLPVASCHIYAGQHGGGASRGVIASGDKEDSESQLRTEAAALLGLFPLRLYSPHAARQFLFILRAFRRGFSP